MTDPLAARTLRKFLSQQEPLADCEEEHLAVAPPGWEGPVKEMKKDKDIDNPWALAWHMKNKGDKPHKKEGSLPERVVARHAENLLAARVAERFAIEEAAKRAPKVKLDMTKLEDLMVKLPFAVKVLDQKRGDKGSEQAVSHLMGEYTDYVRDLRKALEAALPKDAAKERQKGEELLQKIDFFRLGRSVEPGILSGKFPAEKFAEEFHKIKPIFHELHQLLKGQQVLIASDKIDHSLAESEGSKGQARFDDNKKHHTEMKSLLKKVEDADPGAKKKFDSAYDKMFENGEKAAAAAKKLLQKYGDVADNYKAGDKHQIEAALSMIERTLHQWENNKLDHHKAKGAMAGAKMHQGENTYGYAQDLESFVKDFHKALKDPHMEVDDSWRNH